MAVARFSQATTRAGTSLVIKIARTGLLIAVFLSLIIAIVPRLNSYLLALKFQAALAGLKTVRIDQTTEEELLQAVPHLKPEENSSSSNHGVERGYVAVFTNESAWLRFAKLAAFDPGPGPQNSPALKVAGWLGFHYMSLAVSAVVADGKVSSIEYGVASEHTAPRVLGDLVSFRSVHGYWLEHRSPLNVTSADDQSPSYRVKETTRRPSAHTSIDSSLEISFAFDAPAETTEHAFQAQLSCFWSSGGCRSGREILPLAWQDKNSTDAAALARLQSDDPCPDSILAGRVRYLPDVDILLVEVTSASPLRGSLAGGFHYQGSNSYRVLELLRGEMHLPTGFIFNKLTIPSPMDPKQQIPNPVHTLSQPGERLILFGNHNFDSCAAVPDTDSAEALVRATEPAPRRREDQIVAGRLI